MKVLLSVFLLFSLTNLFSQTDNAKKVKPDGPFGEAIYISTDSIQKLPINELLIGKWVLISSDLANGHKDEMEKWNVQTLEFKNDRTVIITPGPYDKKTYWSYIGNEQKLVIYSTEEESIQVQRVKFPILKMKADLFTCTEWVNLKPKEKHYMSLKFLKVE
jgi:hypothetical protein